MEAPNLKIRVLRKLAHVYHKSRNLRPIWYWLINKRSRRIFAKFKRALDDVESDIVEKLKKDGIAIVNISELFPKEIFENMKEKTAWLWNDPKIQNEIIPQRLQAMKNPSDKKREKYFWVWLDGAKEGDALSHVDFSDPFMKFSLDDKILQIVAAYLGVAPKFYSFGLQTTLVMPEGLAPRLSQRWHRDPDDKKMLKVFIYFTDVLDEGAGPFKYVLGSQCGGKWENIFPQIYPVGSYPPDGAIEKIVSKEDIKTCLGPSGTVIFADTSGLHKGGFSTKRIRIMSTTDFVTEASVRPRRYEVVPEEKPSLLKSLSAYAVS